VTSAETVLQYAANLSLVVLCISFFVTVYRVIAGPTLPDRVLALDMLVAVAIGFIAVFAIRTGISLYVDIAIALGLVGFLSTVAFARYILQAGYIQPKDAGSPESSATNNTTAVRHVE
jgi:multicomponent Na+:H+ antiporter subunit F